MRLVVVLRQKPRLMRPLPFSENAVLEVGALGAFYAIRMRGRGQTSRVV
jgi:hypothetical protein